MTIFLSYAREDERVAAEIAEWFGRQGLNVYDWQDGTRRGGQFPDQLEDAIVTATAFVALVSPDYLTSVWCRRERMLAIYMESYQKSVDSTRQFVHVLEVRKTDHVAAGFLGGYDWRDATTAQSRKKNLPDLGQRLAQPVPPASLSKPAVLKAAAPFRNRDDELRRITNALNSPGGDHFWLVTGPPALGKSWLLDRLSAQLIGSRPRLTDESGPAGESGGGWGGRLLDVREQDLLDLRTDDSLLLARMFGLDRPGTDGDEMLREIARQIIGGGRPYLCLLDSADLLEPRTAKRLREGLSKICTLIQRAGKLDVRLGFVVASRREHEWRGIIPEPRMADVALTEFKVVVVRAALDDLARRMGHTFASTDLFDLADRVLRFSEGLPAVLTQCLRWIEQELWVSLDRLESPEIFDRLARPYIQGDLLSVTSLLPQGGLDLGRQQRALLGAFRSLAPYRLLTTSHLHYRLAKDDDLRQAVDDARWDAERLWEAMSHTALLRRLLDEPWHEVSPPIRRLLFRSYHPSPDERAAVHRAALEYVESWVEGLAGADQVRGVAECLFHQAAALGPEDPSMLADALLESARRHCGTLRPSGHAERDLRAALADRILHDRELHAVTSAVPDLVDRLVAVVAPAVEGVT